MLKRVELTNFRKHEAATFSFGEGLVALRGANEAGKSSTIEAVAYALFGTKALRDSFDNVVTWGRKPSELKVTIEFGDHVFTRSKGGAEVTLNGQVVCTGQNEVSTFAAGLLGADVTLAGNLMLATQGSLRGVLDGGPKAASVMIEEISGLDLIDRILDAAASKLALGSSAPYEARIETLERHLENLPAVVAPDEVAYQQEGFRLTLGVNTAEKFLNESVCPERARLQTLLMDESVKRHRVSQLKADLDRCQQQIRDAENDLFSIKAPGIQIDTGPLETRIAELGQAVARRQAYEKFLTLPEPSQRVERVEAESQLMTAKDTEVRYRKVLADADTAVKVAVAQKVGAQNCSLCGLDVSQFPETAKKNAALQELIDAQNAVIIDAQRRLEVATSDRKDLEVISAWEDDTLIRAARPIEQYLERDETQFPLHYSWKGDAPAAVPESEPVLRKQLMEMKAHNTHVATTEGRIATLRGVIARATGQATTVKAEMDGVQAMDDVTFDALAIQSSAAAEAVRRTESTKLEYEMQLATLNTEYRQQKAQYEQAVSQRAAMVGELAVVREQMKDLEFNNGLIKKIRAARPVIGNKLWHLVLATVSQIFTLMRGETSIVTKGKDGFEVNGRAASSLSGSASDLLGLALRCALVKTFIPNCPFIVLDEPCASMDDGRTSMLLGYIAASGFAQCLLVTHESVSESFAQNVIQL